MVYLLFIKCLTSSTLLTTWSTLALKVGVPCRFRNFSDESHVMSLKYYYNSSRLTIIKC